MNFKKISVIPAEKDNEMHKRGIWKVFNENIEFNFLTSEPVPYENHCKWWEEAFEKEFIYVILYQSAVCGYIRLTKERTESKEKNEISIGLRKIYQNSGLGSIAYNLFEKKIKDIGVSEIIAITSIRNELGQKFFEKNKFERTRIRYAKKI
ncbi:MAG: GNAT family N-acetyltransferase [Promethearchaeota archaeon]